MSSDDHNDNTPAVPEGHEPARNGDLSDPGLPAHEYRLTDVDEAMSRRAERQVAGLFVIAMLCFVGFVVAYFAIPNNQDTLFLGFSAFNFAAGMLLGGGLLCIGIGAIHWAKKLMADHEIVEMRHAVKSSDEDRAETLEALSAGIGESGIGRRPLIRNTLLGAVGVLAVGPPLVLLRDLGDLDIEPLHHTVWRRGMRLVNDISGEPIKPEDMTVGQLVNGEPAIFFAEDEDGEHLIHGTELLVEKSKAAIIIVRIPPEDIQAPEGKENWDVDGILCFSKICTHVGCPIALWEQQTHHVLCPCHQSTYDLSTGGNVIFGPAHRPLPQLQLGVDNEGYLIAMGDFAVTVGPSYPEVYQR